MSDNFTGNPNSQHQLWSRWQFVIVADRKRPIVAECRENFRRWAAKGFQTWSGRAQVVLIGRKRYAFTLQIEGPPATDPAYREHVRKQFIEFFMHRGFGQGARLDVFHVGILSGDAEDGKPPAQLLALPTLSISALAQDGQH